jgi:Zn-dependent protease with chaperone function
MVDPGFSLEVPIEGPALYFDGQVARRREVTLRLGASLEIIEGGTRIATWPYAEIRRADGGPGVMRLCSIGAAELARLDIRNDGLEAAIERRCSKLGNVGLSARCVGAVVFWSLAATASIALVAIFGAPLAADRIAPLIPLSLEQRLGEATANEVVALFGDHVCSQPEGSAALHKLVGALVAQAKLKIPVRTDTLDSNVPNAFALPGGRVFVLRALIAKADNVDELAGVIGHELGHVAHRDGLREMISTGGSAFLFGLLFGDVSGSGAIILAGRTLVQSAYSRQAEASADAFSASVMRGLGRSPRPLGEFLLRLTGRQGGGAIAWLASHPPSQDRLEALKKDDAPVTGPALLNDEEWRALKNICAPADQAHGNSRSDDPSPP